jgi:excisionase family DNA binding protein
MTRDTSEPLLTTSAIADLLQVHPKQVYRLLRRGLPGRRVGGEWRFVRGEVLAWSGGGAHRSDRAEIESRTLAVLEPPPLVATAGDVVVELLLALANSAGTTIFGFVQADRGHATELLRRGAVLAAGSHGGIPPARLDGMRLARVHLVSREVGIVGAAGRPVPKLAQLSTRRFASRPATAGIVAHLHAALGAAGLNPTKVLSRARLLDSHRDVVFSVLRGEADAGITTRAWAHRVGLPFQPIATESYGLLLRAQDLGRGAAVRLCEVAQSAPFRSAVAAVPGYDASGAGDIKYDPEPAQSGNPRQTRSRARRRTGRKSH